MGDNQDELRAGGANVDPPSDQDIFNEASQAKLQDQHTGELARPRRKLKREREVDSGSEQEMKERKPTVAKQRSRSKRVKHASFKQSGKK